MKPARLFLSALVPALLLVACGLPPEEDALVPSATDWTLSVVHADGRAYPGAVVRLSPVPTDSGLLTMDATGKAQVRDSAHWMNSRTLQEVNGCPAATLEKSNALPMGHWNLVVDDSLERLCHRTLTFRVEGPAGFPVAWRIPSVLDLGDAHRSRWTRDHGDSTTLDSAGRGALVFNGLIQPFLETPALTLVVGGLSFRRGWQVRAYDSTLVLNWPFAGDTLWTWPGCLRGERDSLCWDRSAYALRHWRRSGPGVPWDSAGCSFGIRYPAVRTDGNLATYPSIDGHRPASCGGDTVHWVLRQVTGNDSVLWMDTLRAQGMLLHRTR